MSCINHGNGMHCEHPASSSTSGLAVWNEQRALLSTAVVQTTRRSILRPIAPMVAH